MLRKAMIMIGYRFRMVLNQNKIRKMVGLKLMVENVMMMKYDDNLFCFFVKV